MKQPTESARVAMLRGRLQAMSRRGGRRRAVAVTALPGGEEMTEHGPLYVIASRYDPSFCHGQAPVAGALRATDAHLSTLALDTAMAGIDTSRLLFIDTETTGLAGGAGTLPFLVGLGWFAAGHWHVEQLLLRQPGAEVPILARLVQRMAQASALVSYNGKTFDWPLLRNRFVLNRMAPPPLLPHVDLLHCARRVMRRRQVPLRLVHAERTLLRFFRHDDIGGAAIPALYFAFMRGAPAATLLPIVTHNAFDMHALAALLGVLTDAVHAPDGCGHPADRLAVAELKVRAGDYKEALAFAHAAALAADDDVAAAALHLMGWLHSRAKHYAAAVAALRESLARAPNLASAAAAHLALAKLYEHRLADWSAALEHAPHTVPAEDVVAQARRVVRLRRKLFSEDLSRDACPPSFS